MSPSQPPEFPEHATPRFDVVAIGASAGGVEALHVLTAALPENLPAAVLVVQHLDPRHDSALVNLLARRSPLPVHQATSGEPVRAGTITVAPPAHHLIVRDGRLVLTETPKVHFSRPAIDVLFRSVAEAYGERALGVILSGTGTDGADGVRAIKARGGTALAQAEASHDGMPQAARATGCIDASLPVDELGPAIARLVRGETEPVR
jgi:two-component system chemotaxis response regulator CheB